jgi:hypothetical protein
LTDGSAASNHTGGTAGTITATIGLAVLAVGIAALVRSHWFGQFALRRPGMVIAAVGQGILLLGLSAQAVYKARHAIRSGSNGISRLPPPANPYAGVWPGVVPVLPLHAGYSWPVTVPVAGSSGSHPGQIAQLKAQLACLSQQLDQLGTAGTQLEKGPDQSG